MAASTQVNLGGSGGVFDSEPSLARDPLLWALAVLSLLVHAVVLPGVLGLTDRSNVPPWSGAMADEPAKPTPPKVRAGVEQSDHPTLTWLGFAEPEEHQARLDTIDQAAMSPDPVAAPEAAPSMPQRGEQAPVLAAEALEATQQSVADGVSAAMELARSLQERAMLAVAMAERRAEAQAEHPAEAQAPAAKPTQEQEPVRTAAEAGLDPESDGMDDQPKGGRQSPSQPAVESEKESAAASTIKPVRVRPGKPAAAQGLDITTVRPRWTYVTRLSALPRDPVLWVKFGRDGRVKQAGFLDGKNTGDARVDGPLLDALYLWTAKGKALEALGPDETLTMTFAIDLGAR